MSSATAVLTAPPAEFGFLEKIAWHWKHNRQIELWIVWWSMPVFYQIFTITYFVLARTQPPPPPHWNVAEIRQWIELRHSGIDIGYILFYLTIGLPGWHIGLIWVLIRRMSVSRAWAYAYLGTMAAGTLPGAVLNGFGYSLLVLRPDRDPRALQFLYEFANLTFVGTMGVFFVGSFILVVAILLDRNEILPKWFGFACIWNLTTEFTVAPAWIFQHGPLTWTGGIAFYWNMVVYGTWQIMYFVVFYKAINKIPSNLPTPQHAAAVEPREQVMATAAQITDETTDVVGQPAHAVGQGAMWVYIVGDLFIFGGWFTFYLVYRAWDPETFFQSQAQLSQNLGMVNTIILLVSSWLVALCVGAARMGRYDEASRYAWFTILAGAVFAASKLYEWTSEVTAGHTFTSNYFFMFYFFLTAIHLFHVLCGFIVLGVLVRQLRTPALRSQVAIENCAAYWHMIDLLWVVIFALLYVMR